jgi:hypothetical protein
LVEHHRPVAEALAEGLTTLIPLAETDADRPVSAASGWAWGAIALSLPSDPLLLAETLIHEFQHLVLGAVEDIGLLLGDESGELRYVPWRDDPRPLASLLQGSYAFLGVTGFWWRQRGVGPLADRQRAEVSFALRRRHVDDVVSVLAHSAVLTGLGRSFIAGMRDRLEPWLAEQVTAEADATARDIDTRHQLRWRLANVRPDEAAIESLARAFLTGRQPPGGWPDSTAKLSKRSTGALLSRDRVAVPTPGSPAPGQHGKDARAGVADEATRTVHRCLGRLGEASDPDTWTELMLALHRLDRYGIHPAGPPVEVVVAVCERVRRLTGNLPDVQAVLSWLERR